MASPWAKNLQGMHRLTGAPYLPGCLSLLSGNRFKRMALDVDQIREQFPSLSVEDDALPRIYFDNPGGTQVSRRVIDRMVRYLESDNANSGAPFRTSEETDQLLAGSHEAVAAFLNAESGREIVFGQNMTTLTFAMSRTLGRTMRSGDEIVVTRMDHDGNVSPWLFLAEDLDLTIRWLDFSPETYRYDLSELDGLLNERTRLVAVNHASNAIGTINDVRSVARRAHAAGALVYVDAVQYAPHAAIDVRSLECDFLVCSSYKFFGPHQGILWGREALLERLVPYKVRPCDDRLPVRFETGTLSHEGIAGRSGGRSNAQQVAGQPRPVDDFVLGAGGDGYQTALLMRSGRLDRVGKEEKHP